MSETAAATSLASNEENGEIIIVVIDEGIAAHDDDDDGMATTTKQKDSIDTKEPASRDKSTSPPTLSSTRNNKKLFHLVILGCIVLLMLVGIKVGIDKSSKKKDGGAVNGVSSGSTGESSNTNAAAVDDVADDLPDCVVEGSENAFIFPTFAPTTANSTAMTGNLSRNDSTMEDDVILEVRDTDGMENNNGGENNLELVRTRKLRQQQLSATITTTKMQPLKRVNNARVSDIIYSCMQCLSNQDGFLMHSPHALHALFLT